MDAEIRKWLKAEEKRGETRLNERAALFIEVESAEPDQPDSGRVVVCEAVDLSANGIQCKIEEQLAVGAIFQVALVLPTFDNVYKLSAEVMWVKQAGVEYATGLRFFDSEGTEIVDWKLTISDVIH
jgi:hypothetical protein